MNVTKVERELARSTHHLRVAQAHLATARLLRVGVKDAEAHVCRMLTYVANAQDAVLAQRKRDPGAIFMRLFEVPFTLDVIA